MALWFDGFMVSCFMVLWFYGLWFYGFVVVLFHDFMDLWFCGFLVSNIYQISISCFQEDIDPISKIFKNLLDGSSGLFSPRLFQICSNCCNVLKRSKFIIFEVSHFQGL